MSEATSHTSPLADSLQPAASRFDINGLERVAGDGLETYKGKRQLEFRVGLEVEFQLADFDKVHKILTGDFSSEAHRHGQVKSLLNPEIIEEEKQAEDGALVDEFRDYANRFVRNLAAKDPEEERIKQEWLAQTEEFGAHELINFLLYEEFSKPQLGVPNLPSSASLRDVDNFAEQNGWLEWRFGNGPLQSGYYDNPGVSEMRLTPCSPTEALRRFSVIKQRLTELGNQFQVPIVSGSNHIHTNLSIFDKSEPDQPSLIGNDEGRAEDTVDVVSGIMATFEDGIELSPVHATYNDYNFSPFHERLFRASPVRESLRVLDGRLELRAGLYDGAEHGLAMLLSGATHGLIDGAESLQNEGHTVASYTDVHRVVRSEGFDKKEDLQIQRMFEKAEMSDNGFSGTSEVGYHMFRQDSIMKDLFGDSHPDGISPWMVVTATKVGSNGIPFVTTESLKEQWGKLPDHQKKSLGVLNESTIVEDVQRINKKLAKIRIVKDKAVVGETIYRGAEKEQLFDRLRSSKFIRLAIGSAAGVEKFIEELDIADKIPKK